MSRADGRTFSDCGAVRGTPCVAGNAGESSGRLAVGESVASDAGGHYADGLAERVAGGATARWGGAGSSPAGTVRTGGAAAQWAAGRPFGEEAWVWRMAKRFDRGATWRPRARLKGCELRLPTPFLYLRKATVNRSSENYLGRLLTIVEFSITLDVIRSFRKRIAIATVKHTSDCGNRDK